MGIKDRVSKDVVANEQLRRLYIGESANKFIYLDIRNRRLMKLTKVVLAATLASIPVIGTVLQSIVRLLA